MAGRSSFPASKQKIVNKSGLFFSYLKGNQWHNHHISIPKPRLDSWRRTFSHEFPKNPLKPLKNILLSYFSIWIVQVFIVQDQIFLSRSTQGQFAIFRQFQAHHGEAGKEDAGKILMPEIKVILNGWMSNIAFARMNANIWTTIYRLNLDQTDSWQIRKKFTTLPRISSKSSFCLLFYWNRPYVLALTTQNARSLKIPAFKPKFVNSAAGTSIGRPLFSGKTLIRSILPTLFHSTLGDSSSDVDFFLWKVKPAVNPAAAPTNTWT